MNVTDEAKTIFDTASNQFYTFVTSVSGPSVQRLDFGTDPTGTPTVVDLGNPNNAFVSVLHSNLEAFELVLDDNGIFHSFMNNRGIVHWVFGNGIGNPPTQASRIYDNPAVLGMGMQMSVVDDGGQWRIFVGQSYGPANIVRFDIGSDLNNIPAVLNPVSLPSTGSNPSNFAILKENNIWYMFSTTLTSNASLYRYTFGASLQNNTPTLVNLGNVGSSLNLNRGLNFLKSCDSFYMLGLDQDGTVRKFDFNNDIQSTPTTQSYGVLYGGAQNASNMVKPYWYGDTLWALTCDFNSTTTTIYRRALMALPPNASSIKYYSSVTEHVFNTPGVYDVVLYCDQADPAGPQTFCKQIVVVGSMNFNLGADTGICVGDTLILGDPNNNGNILWSTGATSSTIKVYEGGTYWVNITGSSCQQGSDTIHVTLNSLPVVQIDQEDTTICTGVTLELNGSGAQYYNWEPSNFITNPDQASISVQPPVTRTYYLKGKDLNGCYNHDSVTITVRQTPDVKITSETTEVSCFKKSVQLQATGANSYLWQPGIYCNDSTISNPLVAPVEPVTIFYVFGEDAFGCQGFDSIEIFSFSEPVFFVPTAFSPNNDGLNDLFVPVIYCDFELLSFKVFNRWGQLVFATNKPNTGWDGIFNNQIADGGVYFWYVEGRDKFGKKMNKKGDVSLIR